MACGGDIRNKSAEVFFTNRITTQKTGGAPGEMMFARQLKWRFTLMEPLCRKGGYVTREAEDVL